MGDETSREGQLLVAVATLLALVSIVLAPTLITDKTYWRPFPFVFLSLLCTHLALGSDHSRRFIAIYLMIFGALRVFGFAVALLTAGPVERNVLPFLGAILGLVAAGILAFSKPLRECVRVRYEARSRGQTMFLRGAWILFGVYCAVLTYLDLTRAA